MNRLIEECLADLKNGKIGELDAYEKLVNLDINTGLELSYYKQDWCVANAEKISETKKSILVVTKDGKTRWSEIAPNAAVRDFHAALSNFETFHVEVVFLDIRSIQDSTKEILLYLYHLIKKMESVHWKGRILCYGEYGEDDVSVSLFEAIDGFAKTLHLENPELSMCVVKREKTASLNLTDIINYECNTETKDADVFYQKERLVRVWREEKIQDSVQKNETQANGVYLVAGGFGKLGQIAVKILLENTTGDIAILGRKNVSEASLKKAFGEMHVRISYYVADLKEKEQIASVIEKIHKSGKCVTGVIHSAGVYRNSYIKNKNLEDAQIVLESKLDGTIHLHEETLCEPLEFFCVYSSIAGVFGKVGQADYAYANSFLNSFTEYRNTLTLQGKCTGNSICINWPFWLEGGMQIDSYEVDDLYERIGMTPLPDEQGANALKNILFGTSGCITVLYGNKEKIADGILESIQDEKLYENKQMNTLSADEQKNSVIKWLCGSFEEIFGLAKENVDKDTFFEEYGIDSVGFGRLQIKLEKTLGVMKKTLLYDTKNIEELADYIVEQKADNLSALFGELKPQKAVSKKKQSVVIPRMKKNRNEQLQTKKDEPIAIIGMSGRFPGADSVEQLWDNLQHGIDSVGEIPEDRWNIKKYNNGVYEHLKPGESYCKWGGFLNNADKFDPQFFHMSPTEAQMTDPQERIMLETAYEAFEDAGYSQKRLETIQNANKSPRVGVFVSGASNTYNLIGLEEWEKGNYVVPNALPWSISNRISYFMNFSGPSFSIDAACAGGLVSVHQAVNALLNRECKMALAGGVNMYLHPYKYVSLSQVKMLSRTGKCYAFSSKADGFIPAESIAALILKPLSEAKKDGDRIYGVIKSSVINHDGSSNGYMAPNPAAQRELVKEAIEKAGFRADDISYIEAHGTGTPVGDPIEINALTDAFRESTNKNQFCSIGSIKTNIGHSEGAAGIVGIIKVLLQMKYKKLVPSLYTDLPSSEIDFKNSPFYVQNKLEPWNTTKRVAGISSFGAGGANGHIIIEGYENQVIPVREEKDKWYVVPVSAMTKLQLDTLCREIKIWIDAHAGSVNIGDIAYVLQNGRNPFTYKAAFICQSIGELQMLVDKYLKNEMNENIILGKSRTKSSQEETGGEYMPGSEAFQRTIAEGWTSGKWVDWFKFKDKSVHMLSLPHYPFLKKRCWVERVTKKTAQEELGSEAVNTKSPSIVKKSLEEQVADMIETDQFEMDKIQSILDDILK